MKKKVNLCDLIINLLTKSAHDELKVKKGTDCVICSPNHQVKHQ
jgi:hypothetical protein